MTVSDPGVRLLLANGLTADDVEVTLELPESYVLGSDPEVYAVYTVHGGEKAGEHQRACGCGNFRPA